MLHLFLVLFCLVFRSETKLYKKNFALYFFSDRDQALKCFESAYRFKNFKNLPILNQKKKCHRGTNTENVN